MPSAHSDFDETLRICMQDSSELLAHVKDKEAERLNMSHSAGIELRRSLGDFSFRLNLLWIVTWSHGLLQKLSRMVPGVCSCRPSLDCIKTCRQEQIYPSNYVSSLLLSSDVSLSWLS